MRVSGLVHHKNRGQTTVSKNRRNRGLSPIPDWLEVELPAFFAGRTLLVDAPVLDRWARLLARIRGPAPAIDSLIAATALHHGFALVTRNEADSKFPELDVINPWPL